MFLINFAYVCYYGQLSYFRNGFCWPRPRIERHFIGLDSLCLRASGPCAGATTGVDGCPRRYQPCRVCSDRFAGLDHRSCWKFNANKFNFITIAIWNFKNDAKSKHTHFASVLNLYDDFPSPSLRQLLVYYVGEDTRVVGNFVLFHLFVEMDSSEYLLDRMDPTTMCHIRWQANIFSVTAGCRCEKQKLNSEKVQ